MRSLISIYTDVLYRIVQFEKLMSTPFEKKHQSIVSAAIRVFVKNGFGATTMDKIAETAGLSKVTVYNHFKDKRQLFQEVMMIHCQQLAENTPLIEFSPASTPKKLLNNFGHALVGVLLDKKSIALMRVVIFETGQFP